ncbi:MAG: globin [Alphaproteobacteria bacterium]|nr:globin [Alphaproteobacteria bacterium]
MDATTIERSLELVAEHGDPAPAVYRRLFAAYPDMEALFVRDTDGSIRGNMLSEAIAALLDFIGGNRYGANLMRIEVVNHENLGVPREIFPAFFTAMRDSFAEILGAAWSNDIDQAWREMLGEIEATLAGVS